MLDTKFWEKYFKAYDVLNVLIPYQELKNEIIKSLDIQQGEKILDLGSGTGNIAIEVEKLGAQVTGMDFSEEGVKRHKTKNQNAKIILGDISQRLPFNDSTFDKVYSNNVIYAIDKSKRQDIFNEIHRVLKPGGKVVISNITKNFKPLLIYIDHIKKQTRRDGFIKTFIEIVKLAPVTLKMFYYNYLIKKENKAGNYNFFMPEEQKVLLKSCQFQDVSDDIYTYSNQAILNEGKK